MTLSSPTAEELRQGRRRLKALLPLARVLARSMEYGMDVRSSIMRAQLPYLVEAHMEALVIYPAPLGSWHVDLLLKRVPPGVANSLGSSSGKPEATRDDADKRALRFLAAVLATGQQPAPAPDPAFVLHEIAIPLPRELYDKAAEASAGGLAGYGTHELARQRVADTVAQTFPRGFTVEALNALSRVELAQLMTVLLIATLNGVFRYPFPADGTPSGHVDAAALRTPH